jgi:ABC-type phosphate/phosphonate transport system substrate-binding protein
MNSLIAALPMYDWPEVRAQVDAEWVRLRDALRGRGVDAPERLARCNGDLPPVPGGIRDASGTVVAADPATLPPDELDPHGLWQHPNLLFAQTCWGPMEQGLAERVQVVGQPDYSAFDGGQGAFYSSAIVMRQGNREDLRSTAPPSVLPDISPARGEIRPSALLSPIFNAGEESAKVELPISPLAGEMSGRTEGGAVERNPSSRSASLPLDLLRGKRLAYNSPDSMSGIIALTRDLEAMGETLDIFSKRLETEGHRASVVAVAEGRADVAAIDCRSWVMAQRFEPAAKQLAAVGWTARRKGLPYITARNTPAATIRALREALSELGMTAAPAMEA